ncbi:MAG: four helix bundle protein [bacterium]
MEGKERQISNRLLDYASAITKLCIKLHKTAVGRHIGNQLVYSGTSVGASCGKACRAHGRADFIHRLQLILKELRESLFWLRVVRKSEIPEGDNVDGIIEETRELSNIIGK